MYSIKDLPLILVMFLIFNIDGGKLTTSRAESLPEYPTINKQGWKSHYAVKKQQNAPDDNSVIESPSATGNLEEIKKREFELSRLLEEVRREKGSVLRSKPLTIGIVGFGRFGQFIARTFQKHGRVVVTSRSDYTEIASSMGVKYVPLKNPEQFLEEDLDVIVIAVSILSFEKTIIELVPYLSKYLKERKRTSDEKTEKIRGPLFVDVLSVKEHARELMLGLLPPECDILCTHPMFGPDSGKNGWKGLNFVYEKTRIDGVVLNNSEGVIKESHKEESEVIDQNSHPFHPEDSSEESRIKAFDRVERFLSIWEEEGCRMISMGCKDHDSYTANSQFVTHLMGRILGEQGLSNTPIDTTGFQSVLQLVDVTTADSFDLFYGLYKYNQNSIHIIQRLQLAMKRVVEDLKKEEKARAFN
mmetsp:Transcript_36631/g.41789  ORF Transcript_36631/g.41789 Transcript_36631/m.41789 type:complete len:415 (-) Transcript_36631:70-1314(-)